jgi:hypothetical protein
MPRPGNEDKRRDPEFNERVVAETRALLSRVPA